MREIRDHGNKVKQCELSGRFSARTFFADLKHTFSCLSNVARGVVMETEAGSSVTVTSVSPEGCLSGLKT